MKQEFIHLLICNNLITAVHVGPGTHELLFSNARIANTDKIFTTLAPFYHLPVRLMLNTPNLIIKSFNTKGMNPWHQYQLIQRVAKESNSEWYATWKEQHSLIFVKGTLSDTERDFLQQLSHQKYLIESIVPTVWFINTLLLKGHTIKQNGVVLIPMADQFLQILYLEGTPTISRIINTSDTTDWVEFVRTKHQLTLDVLDTTRLISSLGKATDSFETFALEHLPPEGYPNIVFAGTSPRKYFHFSNGLRTLSKIMMMVSGLFLAGTIPGFIDIATHQTTIDALLNNQKTLLNDYPLAKQQDATSKLYTHKRQVVETFNAQTFPTMYFLERISTLLPNYGQVIYVRITPSISKISPSTTDEFSVHLRLVPSKSSKNLQLLISELHQLFGDKLQVNIVQNPTVSMEHKNDTTQLKHTVQINLTGMIHELQRLTP